MGTVRMECRAKFGWLDSIAITRLARVALTGRHVGLELRDGSKTGHATRHPKLVDAFTCAPYIRGIVIATDCQFYLVDRDHTKTGHRLQ